MHWAPLLSSPFLSLDCNISPLQSPICVFSEVPCPACSLHGCFRSEAQRLYGCLWIWSSMSLTCSRWPHHLLSYYPLPHPHPYPHPTGRGRWPPSLSLVLSEVFFPPPILGGFWFLPTVADCLLIEGSKSNFGLLGFCFLFSVFFYV